MLRLGLTLIVIALLAVPSFARGDDVSVSSEYRSLVPRYLMPLLHTPEVQQELNFSPSQLTELENLFAEIDGDWFRARIQPKEKQVQILDQLEQQTYQWLAEHTSKEQQERLAQLEYQAQSIRALLRTDLGKAAGFSESQQRQLASLARETDAAHLLADQAKARGEDAAELEAIADQKAAEEKNSLQEIFEPEQLGKVSQLLGVPFDTQQLTRIYPMAPEFVGGQPWINSSPLSLKQLRGKVVLVHFYAFECHNCHANFPIYNRWQQELAKQGVVIIGIQTPETARERDLNAVKAAAIEKGLDFPILVDFKSENWQAWGNTMWPTVYVVDKNGYIRQWWQGELNWKGATGDKSIENAVDRLLAEEVQQR